MCHVLILHVVVKSYVAARDNDVCCVLWFMYACTVLSSRGMTLSAAAY